MYKKFPLETVCFKYNPNGETDVYVYVYIIYNVVYALMVHAFAF